MLWWQALHVARTPADGAFDPWSMRLAGPSPPTAEGPRITSRQRIASGLILGEWPQLDLRPGDHPLPISVKIAAQWLLNG